MIIIPLIGSNPSTLPCSSANNDCCIATDDGSILSLSPGCLIISTLLYNGMKYGIYCTIYWHNGTEYDRVWEYIVEWYRVWNILYNGMEYGIYCIGTMVQSMYCTMVWSTEHIVQWYGVRNMNIISVLNNNYKNTKCSSSGCHTCHHPALHSQYSLNYVTPQQDWSC